MENQSKFSALLENNLPSPTHNRYQFYKDYALDGIVRGERVYKILGKFTPLDNKAVLDLGCGYGGTAIYFSQQGCSVLALDIDYAQIKACLAWAGEKGLSLSAEVASAENLAVLDKSFDIVIMHDVLEHVKSIEITAGECSRTLKKGGFVFLTIPNRLSIPNIISDPHFGYFGIILLPVKIADFYIKHIRRKTYGYRVLRYPSLGFIFKTFANKGISLQKIGLSEKFYDPSLIGSPLMRKIVLSWNNCTIIKGMAKIGLLGFFMNLFNRFISRGFILVGEKEK